MNKQPIGELLREMREAQGISMRSLANSADMDPAYLSRIENGKTGVPKQDTVERLAEALCKEQLLEEKDCKHLTRQLLMSSGYLQNREDLIDDLADRFSVRLRDEGFPEDKIDEALARVPLATMRKVLLDEEKLEVGYRSEFSNEQVQARRDDGEEVLSFSYPAVPKVTSEVNPPANVEEAASDYLDRHAEEFTTHRRHQRALSTQRPSRAIRAGREAEIRLHRPVSKEQEQQLRLIAKLINSILEEKN